MGDLVRSLGIVLVLVAVVVLLVARHDSPPKTVDAAPLLVAARSDAGFAVVDPAGAPDGWRLTSARYLPTSSETGAQWHLGWETEAETYAAVDQGVRPAADVVTELVRDATRTGDGTGAWSGWAHWAGSRPGWQAYTIETGDAPGHGTVVLYGSSTDEQLLELRAALGLAGLTAG